MTNALFHNVCFPIRISYGSRGGPERRTEISLLASGYEQRNSPWMQARRKYQLIAGPRPLEELYELLDFFEARRGRLYGFCWKDWLDNQSSHPDILISPLDQPCLQADENRQIFLLQKKYGTTMYSSIRRIFKPIVNTVTVAVNGVTLTNSEFTVDDAEGRIELTQAVSVNHVVTAGFHFYIPVRFDTDFLDIQLTADQAGIVQNVPLVELRLQDTST